MGTCVPTAECQRRGGSTIGTCASGYGVCCACKYAKIPSIEGFLSEKSVFLMGHPVYLHVTK